MSQQKPQVQRLRLTRLNRESTSHPKILRNLQPLVNNNKKKVAQTYYYENNPHPSPLTRGVKPPVHERLGVKHFRSSQLPLGTSTASILPKRRLLRRNNTIREWRQQRLNRLYSAQSRIERIRCQQRSNNAIIKLRRINTNPTVSNLTVQVKNPNYKSGPNGLGKFSSYRFKMFLNPKIRAEILDIQKDSGGCSGDSMFPILNITPVTTRITISERFGTL